MFKKEEEPVTGFFFFFSCVPAAAHAKFKNCALHSEPEDVIMKGRWRHLPHYGKQEDGVVKILIADDEEEIRTVIRLLLENQGYDVREAADGEDAVAQVREHPDTDLVIMDICMPRLSGIEATEKIRAFSAVPVLFLTAKSLHRDKAAAYETGGDDYLVKPFVSGELLMKVQALTRRYNSYRAKGDTEESLALSPRVTLNPGAREVIVGGDVIDIRDREMDVLIYLAKNRGRVVSPKELYEAVWDEMALPSSANTITVHILNLRRKLEENAASPKIIRTVWGKGYQIDEKP